jgi:hypothetical protein
MFSCRSYSVNGLQNVHVKCQTIPHHPTEKIPPIDIQSVRHSRAFKPTFLAILSVPNVPIYGIRKILPKKFIELEERELPSLKPLPSAVGTSGRNRTIKIVEWDIFFTLILSDCNERTAENYPANLDCCQQSRNGDRDTYIEDDSLEMRGKHYSPAFQGWLYWSEQADNGA